VVEPSTEESTYYEEEQEVVEKEVTVDESEERLAAVDIEAERFGSEFSEDKTGFEAETAAEKNDDTSVDNEENYETDESDPVKQTSTGNTVTIVGEDNSTTTTKEAGEEIQKTSRRH
jgi:hypothetical protein